MAEPAASASCPAFIDKVVDFPQHGKSYELLQPLTDFRKNQDGTPAEARILFTCRQQIKPDSEAQEPHTSGTGDEYVVKIKVQVPDGGQKPEAGPSTTTSAELKALESFRDAEIACAPHLVAWKQAVQGPDGLLPGGYLTYSVMTKMSGQNLLDLKYWTIAAEQRAEIGREFLKALRSIHSLGIEPLDRALRNVMWEPETKKCTIIDFELWRETKEAIKDETRELQRWGLARRPPPKTWWGEWTYQDT